MNKASKRLAAKETTVAHLRQSSFARPIEDEHDVRGRDHQTPTERLEGRCEEAAPGNALPNTVVFEPRVAIARGVLILDGTASTLQRPLQSLNFIAYSMSAVLTDEEAAALLTQRVLVTSSAEAFREMAAIHEFSIINTSAAGHDPNEVAHQISSAWSKLRLKAKHSFILRLAAEGESLLEAVE